MTVRRGVTIAALAATLIVYAITHASIPSPISAGLTPDYSSSTAAVITEPDAGIAPLLQMLQQASSSIDLVMYQLEDTQVEQTLVADEARGVAVRVLLNGGYYGTKENTNNDAAYAYLSGHGVLVHWTPARFALTHEKSIVIDKNIAVIMTMNLTPQYYASGREFVVTDNDSSDVDAMETTFDADWNDTALAAPNGEGLIWSPGSEAALISLIDSAQKSLDIYNEEMADSKIISALERAAERGVSVRVVMTYSSNWKKAFTELTAAGVAVRTYAANAPLYIHAKVIIRDGTQAFLGSENFSSNSLNKNRELGLILSNPSVLSSLEATFATDWSNATPFTSQSSQ